MTTRYSLRGIFTVFMLSMAATVTANAQGAFTKNGFGVGSSFSTQDNVTTIGGDLGYVFSGMAEVGLSVARAALDEEEANIVGVGPFVGFYPLRQNRAVPLSVRVGGSYASHSFGGNGAAELEDLGVDIIGSSWDVGGAIFHEAQLSPTVSIIPAAGVNYVESRIKFDDGVDELSETDGSTVVSFSASLVVDVSPKSRFAVTPSVQLYDGDTAFGAALAFVIPR